MSNSNTKEPTQKLLTWDELDSIFSTSDSTTVTKAASSFKTYKFASTSVGDWYYMPSQRQAPVVRQAIKQVDLDEDIEDVQFD